MKQNSGKVILAGILMLLSVASVFAWYYMPIYPDEIAFRLQLGRYIQDKGVVHGLYSLCASNVKDAPLLFVFPAWLLSSLDLALSPVLMRIIPFIGSLLAIFSAIFFSIKGRNASAAVVVTTAFLGVAGSALVLARYEVAQTLNVVCCLLSIIFLASNAMQSRRLYLRYIFVVLLLTSSLLSLYAHIQGLLFLPLTFYLLYQLLCLDQKGSKLRTAILLLTIFIVLTLITINFSTASCAGYPEIERFWAKMTLDVNSLESFNIFKWLVIKIKLYLRAFLYLSIYPVQYLPGIIPAGKHCEFYLLILNRSIQIVVLLNFILLILITIGLLFAATKKLLSRGKKTSNNDISASDQTHTFSLVLFVAPLIFLFFYDAAQNFYRSIFINFMVVIALSMAVSRIPLSRHRRIVDAYFWVCGTTVLASLVTNLFLFTGKLRDGYEGPSISIKKDWSIITDDVIQLSHECSIDLSKGRIIIDDLTYDSLKHYPRLYPITYLSLTSGLTKMSNIDVINTIQPNAAIARCDSMRALGLNMQKSHGELCCVNFLQGN